MRYVFFTINFVNDYYFYYQLNTYTIPCILNFVFTNAAMILEIHWVKKQWFQECFHNYVSNIVFIFSESLD